MAEGVVANRPTLLYKYTTPTTLELQKMARSLVVHGPKACGKTRNAVELMRRHGLDNVVELADLTGLTVIHAEGVLYLHFDQIIAERTAHQHDLRVMPYSAAITTVTA